MGYLPHMKLCSFFLAVAFVSSVSGAGETQNPVSCRTLSNDMYELTVTVQNTRDIFAAQELLIPEARKICGGKPYQFGHYSFTATENLSNVSDSAHRPSPRLTLKQQVACGPTARTSSGHVSYDWVPTDADNQLVAARTRAYLAQKDKGELAQAYSQFSDAMKASASFGSWRITAEGLSAKEGPVRPERYSGYRG